MDGKALASIEMGDPATEVWKAVGALPTARGGLACAVFDSKLYVAGGTTHTAGAHARLMLSGLSVEPCEVARICLQLPAVNLFRKL